MAVDRWRLHISAAFLALVIFTIEIETLSLDEIHSSHANDDSDSLQRALESVENRRLLVERILQENSHQPWKRYVKNSGRRRYGGGDPDLALSDKKKRTYDAFHHPLPSSGGWSQQDSEEVLPDRVMVESAEDGVPRVSNGNQLQDVRKKEEEPRKRDEEEKVEENGAVKTKTESEHEGQQATSIPMDDASKKTEEGTNRTRKTKRSGFMWMKKRRDDDSSRLLKLQSLAYGNMRKRSKGLNSFSLQRRETVSRRKVSPFAYSDSRKKKRTLGSREHIQLNGGSDKRYLNKAKRTFKSEFPPSEDKRQDENKHLQVWKRGERSFTRGSENIMGELSEILSDGKNAQEVKKREIDDNEKKKSVLDAKENNNHSDSVREEQVPLEEGPKPEKELNEEAVQEVDRKDPGRTMNEKEAFYNWLQNEYFKTMARSMVSAKRKRSDWIPMVSVDANRPKNLKTEEVKETVKARIESSDDDTAAGKKRKNRRMKDITEKMQMIEKAMVEDALALIANGAAHDSKDAEKDMAKIVDKLGAAYDVKQMRGALNDLEETFARMAESKADSTEASVEDDEGSKRKKADTSLLYPDSGEEYNSIRPHEAFPSEMPLDSEFGPPFPSVFSERDMENEIDGDTDLMNEKEFNWGSCPPLQLLTSDCSALESFIPRGRAGELLLRVCNWHEVCYTCGEAFGLEAHDCDGGFVQETETICVNDIPCRTTARMMLLPLRERRVFYKRSVPDACYMDPCVESFLQQRN